MMYPKRLNPGQLQQKQKKNQVRSDKLNFFNGFLMTNPQINHDQKKQNQSVNQKEQTIKQNQVQTKQNDKKQYFDTISIQSKTSRMSGASNFDNVLINSKRQQKSKKILNLNNEQNQRNDLDFMPENSQWASILKFNNYLQKKKDVIVNLKNKKIKKDYKHMLDLQMQEKKRQHHQFQMDELEYHNTLLKQLDIDGRREVQKIQNQKEKEEEVKIIRDKLIQIKKEENRDLKKRDQQNDQQFVNQLKYELKVEKEFDRFKKKNMKEINQRFKQETQAIQQKKDDQKQKEIQEELAFQKNYTQILLDQDLENQQKERDRQERNNQFLIQVKKTVLNDHKMKIAALEHKTKKYEDRQIEKEIFKEQMDKKKVKEQQSMMKEYLFKQIDDKQFRKQQETDEIKLQAQILKQDTNDFFEFQRIQKEDRQKMYKMHQNQIIEQMNNRQQEAQPITEALQIQDQLLDEQLNDDIQQLKIQIMD